jgi:hypothetical protein
MSPDEAKRLLAMAGTLKVHVLLATWSLHGKNGLLERPPAARTTAAQPKYAKLMWKVGVRADYRWTFWKFALLDHPRERRPVFILEP